jgi:hypothetical protein
MHSTSPSSTIFGRRFLLRAASVITVILTSGCRDFLAPEPVEDIPEWVVEVGHKATSPEIIGPRAGSDSTKSAAADPNSSAISR